MQVDLRREHGVECSYMVCFKAKEHVLMELNGERQENFPQLFKFLTIFEENNLETVMANEAPSGI
ncbi:hypothetical protein JG687_00015013 [Phytophthora cactorum]|uniref:Uncharacterized protein n=1 Tax=Phytophthora cactorum TaxID=29920 RepID=A0A329SYK3_9STRA|nr:hypothetical protein JG687_00015013 [Phytophthora cactorum]RAW41665.1 hypothetical protein PC110_g2132 [Phytophthora cactorum]